MFDHPDIPTEQAHIDRAYESLIAMREQALRMRKMTVGQVGGTAQERVERNYFDEKLVQMLNDIDIGDGALVFGRIDQAADAGGEPEAFHIGRLAVHDATTTSWSSTGARRSPSRFIARRVASRWGWCAAGTSWSTAAG